MGGGEGGDGAPDAAQDGARCGIGEPKRRGRNTGWGLGERRVKAATASWARWGLSKRQVKTATTSAEWGAASGTGDGGAAGNRASGWGFFFFCTGACPDGSYGRDHSPLSYPLLSLSLKYFFLQMYKVSYFLLKFDIHSPRPHYDSPCLLDSRPTTLKACLVEFMLVLDFVR